MKRSISTLMALILAGAVTVSEASADQSQTRSMNAAPCTANQLHVMDSADEPGPEFEPESESGSESGDALTRRVQRDLNTLGYDPGPANGVATTETAVAISKYQAEHDMPVTGLVSLELAGFLAAAVDGQRWATPPEPSPPRDPDDPRDPGDPMAPSGQPRIKSMTYTEVSKLDAHSIISQIVRLSGMDPTGVRKSELHIQNGRTLISGNDGAVTVFDLERGEFLMIDHNNQLVICADIESLHEITSEMVEGLRAQFESSQMMYDLETMGSEMTMDFEMDVYPDQRTAMIGSHTTSVHYIVMQATIDAPQGSDASGPVAIWFVLEIWEAKDIPSEDEFLREFGTNAFLDPRVMKLAELSGGSSSDPMAAFGILDMWSPGMGQAMYEMMEAAEQFTGPTLRDVIAVLMAPYGMKVPIPNLAAMVAADPEAATAMSMARSAIQGALAGRLPFGRQAPSSPDPEPSYTPYLRLMNTREDFSYRDWEGDVIGELRQSIANYRMQELADVIREFMPPP